MRDPSAWDGLDAIEKININTLLVMWELVYHLSMEGTFISTKITLIQCSGQAIVLYLLTNPDRAIFVGINLRGSWQLPQALRAVRPSLLRGLNHKYHKR